MAMGWSSFLKSLTLIVLIASSHSMLSAAARVYYTDPEFRMLASKKGYPSPPPPPIKAPPRLPKRPPKRLTDLPSPPTPTSPPPPTPPPPPSSASTFH
ncbi:hypothetical protein O6P43_008532 [Quillaja saponaria]|uniref:Uncharacterized protein n=1 Tax=Quillaja saponaria TaxID=32244 RepID=A0AAD7M5J1_QUISA|nr:hypothetical protein O6P43_008532 [Quillaja saponaria]